MNEANIILAGATGDLGGRIARILRDKKISVRALIRGQSTPGKIEQLQQLGVSIAEVDYSDATSVTKSYSGGTCVVSALSGLREVIVNAQTVLLDAAIEAGVPRFIPSDYSIDFTKLKAGTNRNLDLHREFHQNLEGRSIKATSIFNGAFMDMLIAEMPLILFKFRRILYWGNADQLMDFTTKDDTAMYTAEAALDSSTPRFLRIAGDQVNCRDLVRIASDTTGDKFRLFRAGGLSTLCVMIKIMHFLMAKSQELYPPWQGMQYMHNMASGLAKLEPLDNDRYPGINWTATGDVIASR